MKKIKSIFKEYPYQASVAAVLLLQLVLFLILGNLDLILFVNFVLWLILGLIVPIVSSDSFSGLTSWLAKKSKEGWLNALFFVWFVIFLLELSWSALGVYETILILSFGYFVYFISDHLAKSKKELKSLFLKNCLILVAFILINQAVFIPLISPRISSDNQILAVYFIPSPDLEKNLIKTEEELVFKVNPALVPLVRQEIKVPIEETLEVKIPNYNPFLDFDYYTDFLIIKPKVTGWQYGTLETSIRITRKLEDKEQIGYDAYLNRRSFSSDGQVTLAYSFSNPNSFPIYLYPDISEIYLKKGGEETEVYQWLENLTKSDKNCVCFSNEPEDFFFIAGTKEKVHSCILKENLLNQDVLIFQVTGKIEPSENKEVLLTFTPSEDKDCT